MCHARPKRGRIEREGTPPARQEKLRRCKFILAAPRPPFPALFVHVGPQVDAVLDPGFERTEHLRPALAIAIARL